MYSKMYLPLFHASVFALNSYVIWYDQQYLDIPFPAEGYKEIPFRARSMFLTLWCLTFTTLYFFVSLLNDVFGEESPRKSYIRQLKDVMFSFTFPVAVFVVTGFWAVYAYDDQLIFPDYVKAIVPQWVNCVLHIFVAVFLIVEVLVTRISYPSRVVGLGLTAVFNFAYVIWMHMLYERTGAWPYPLFETINTAQRFAFIVVGMFVGLGYYVMGEKLSLINAPKHKSKLNGVNGVNGVHKKNF